MNRATRILVDLVPLFFGMIALIFVKNELIVSALVVIIIAATFWLRYEKGEFLLLLIGIACGAVLELGGDAIYKLQYWESGLVWGIPLWLFLCWGYFFVIIRRLGNEIVKK